MNDKTTKTEMTPLGVALERLRGELTETRKMTKQTFAPVVCGVSRTAVNDWELNRFRPHPLARKHIRDYVRNLLARAGLEPQNLAGIEEALADIEEALADDRQA